MEGGDISPFAQGVFDQYIKGDITLSDVGLKLKEHHKGTKIRGLQATLAERRA